MALMTKGRLSKMMLEIISELTPGTKKIKDSVVLRLGMIGQMSTTRDINAAWMEAKKKAANLYPDKFILDDRNILHWNDGKTLVLDKKISNNNYKKLNEIADSENCNVDTLISRLIAKYMKMENN